MVTLRGDDRGECAAQRVGAGEAGQAVAEHGRGRTDRRWRVVAVAAVLALAACSDDDADPAGGAEPTTTITTVPAADGGTVDETVPSVPVVALDPVALDAVGDFGDGVTARITSIEPVELEATLPGEISGPGVALTVELTNGTDAPLDLTTVAVELVATGDRYQTLITTPDDEPLAGELAPGESGTGTYRFTIAEADRAEVMVRVNYLAPKPTVVFTGSLPGA